MSKPAQFDTVARALVLVPSFLNRTRMVTCKVGPGIGKMARYPGGIMEILSRESLTGLSKPVISISTSRFSAGTRLEIVSRKLTGFHSLE